MRSRRLALIVTPFLLLAMLPGAVSAAGPSPQAQSRAEVLKYWTPERMKAAKWLDVEYDPIAQQGRLKPRTTAVVGNSGGSSWPATLNDEMTRATGRVYFAFGRSAYICSGTVVTDTRTGYSTVLTAAHCVYDQKSGRFASQWLFIPAFDVNPTYTCASTPLGCWNAVSITTRSEFTSAKRLTNNALQHDWAFVIVGGGGKTGTASQLDTTVGGSLTLNATNGVGSTMTAIGYPAAAPYNGNDLTYCQNVVGTDSNTGGTTYQMACNMTGGSSGGPWVSNANLGYGATLRSLNSYGYSGVSNMYGPIFSSQTSNTLTFAQAQTSGNFKVSN